MALHIPISHLIIYGDIRRKANGSRVIHLTEIKPLIKWRVRIPSKNQKEIVQELVVYGLLKRLGRDTYEIMPCNRKPPVDSLGEPFWN